MDYAPYLQKALRCAVHDILTDVAEKGLSGDSYYYMTFETNRADVKIPDFVRAKYPQEMSIILQNQFSNLVVDTLFFEVDLAFGGVAATIHIPFTALKFFADPAANFGLTLIPEKPQTEKEAPPFCSDMSSKVIDLESLRRR